MIVSGQTVQYNLQLPMSAVPTQLADAMHLGQPGLAPDYAPLLKTVEQKIHVRADDSRLRSRARRDHATAARRR